MRIIALALCCAVLPTAAPAQDAVMAGQGAVLDSMNYNNTRNSYRRAGRSEAEFRRDMRRTNARRSSPRLTAAERQVRDNPDAEMRRLCAQMRGMKLRPSGQRTYQKWCAR